MRWIMSIFVLTLLLCVGCSRDMAKPAGRDAAMARPEVAMAPGEVNEPFVAAQNKGVAKAPGDQGKPKADDLKDKPRKIRYTGDMKLIVEKIDVAEEALDVARKEAKGEYEKAEVNRSANTVRTGVWRVRVPNDNLQAFRKAVAKLGDVERDVIESEDMTVKYYDLERHIANRKAHEKAVRDFLVEIGKKDQRYMQVWNELEQITESIDQAQGRLNLWKDLTDLTTFTITMREKQAYNPPPPPKLEAEATFGERASKTWTGSWDLFVGFLQGIVIVAIALAPWLPIPLVLVLCLYVLLRRLTRSTEPPVVVEVVEDGTKKA